MMKNEPLISVVIPCYNQDFFYMKHLIAWYRKVIIIGRQS